MDTARARRYARQISLSDVGPDGQERICRARAAVVGDGLAADTAALYLAAAGVGSLTRLESTPRPGAAWLEALAEVDVVVRAGFDDDAMAGAAARLGLPVVVVRATPELVDVVSFPPRAPDPDASLAVPAQATTPGANGAEAVLAGTLAAAEALVALADPTSRGGAVRHLRLPLDGREPLAQTIGTR
jgi:hypothetical protein